MLLNYLKLAIRLLIRDPFFTGINIIGLSIGFAAFFGLSHYATTELKSDQYHSNYNRIARLCIDWRWTDDGENWDKLMFGWFPTGTINQIQSDFPEIESTVRILSQEHFKDRLVGHGNQIFLTHESPGAQHRLFRETKAAYADANLFDFFSIPLIHGNRKTILSEPNFVALSHATAQKYFGLKNPVGEFLLMNGQLLLEVSGVFEDLPGNTHLNFDFVISNIPHIDAWNSDLSGDTAHGYVQFHKKEGVAQFPQKVNTRTEEYWASWSRDFPGFKASIVVQPLAEIAFTAGYIGDHFATKSKSMLVALSMVGLIILLMAWVNYINLTLARTRKRMKEVGTRRMVGAGAADFVKQFLTESILMNSISAGVALTILQIIRIPAQSWLDLTAPKWSMVSLSSMLLFLLVVSSGVIITALYPAYMSIRYNPRTLFSMASPNRLSNWPAGILTTFQYCSAVVLITGTLIIAHQVTFILNKNIGVFRKQVGIIQSPITPTPDLARKIESFRLRLLSSAHVQDAVTSRSVPGHRGENIHLKKLGSDTSIGLDCQGGVSENYIPFYQIKILAGRNFIADDRSNVILLSRVAIERLGYRKPEDAISARVIIQLVGGASWVEAEVIGVFQDYRTNPYFNVSQNNTEHSRGRGIILTYKDNLFPQFIPNRVAVRLDGSDLHAAIGQMEEIYRKMFPGDLFVFYFLDDFIANYYTGQKISRNRLIFFTLVALGIACLGLLGIISNKVVQKTKEIGIRKALGAGSLNIGVILLNTTTRQVGLSILIGIPAACYFSSEYLRIFSERITIEWWHLIAPVGTMVIIMMAAIWAILIKAARTNPVESLRYE